MPAPGLLSNVARSMLDLHREVVIFRPISISATHQKTMTSTHCRSERWKEDAAGNRRWLRDYCQPTDTDDDNEVHETLICSCHQWRGPGAALSAGSEIGDVVADRRSLVARGVLRIPEGLLPIVAIADVVVLVKDILLPIDTLVGWAQAGWSRSSGWA